MEAPKSVKNTDASATTLQEAVMVVVKVVEGGEGDEWRKVGVKGECCEGGGGGSDEGGRGWGR